MTNNTDCYDANADAHPNQQSYFTSHRGDNSFNYDCSVDSNGNPTIQRGYFQVPVHVSPWLDTIGDCTMNSTSWVGFVRDVDCLDKFIDDNDDCNGLYCFEVLGQTVCLECDDGQQAGSRTQSCR